MHYKGLVLGNLKIQFTAQQNSHSSCHKNDLTTTLKR